MSTLSLTRLAVAVGGLALSLTTAGVAFAYPYAGPVVNTSCSYQQVVSALNAENPPVAAAFNDSPAAQMLLGQFLASPPGDRMQMIQQLQASPEGQQSFGVIQQIAAVCNYY